MSTVYIHGVWYLDEGDHACVILLCAHCVHAASVIYIPVPTFIFILICSKNI